MPTLANRNNNPGNLRFIGQQGASQGEGGFAKFNSPEEGYAALLNDVQSKVSGKSRSGLRPTDTLVDFTKIYAPSSDNNAPGSYAAAVANKMGVSPATSLQELEPRIGELAEAIAHHEGYQGQESATGFNPKPFSQPTKGQEFNFSVPAQPSMPGKSGETSLGGELIGRTNKAAEAIKNTLTGQINPVSGVLQTAGAVAGGLGDIVNKGVNFVTFGGLSKLEGLLGKGIGELAKTEAGQTVSKAIQDFSTAHPELSADIGASFNIVTAIPILKGLGALKNVALDAASIALKQAAEKGAAKDLTEVLGRTIKGRGIIENKPEMVDAIIKEGAMPEIVTEGGKPRYSTKLSYETISNKISTIDNSELQPILDQISAKQTFGQRLDHLKNLAIKEAEKVSDLKEAGLVPQAISQIEKRFNGWKHSYGDSINLADENRIKIGSGKFSDWNSPEGSADKAIYRALQKNIEDVASKHGLADVHEINQRMGSLIKAKTALKYIDGKALKEGAMIKLVKKVPGVGPMGEYAARKISPKAIQGNILKRTSGQIPKQANKTRKIGGLIGTALMKKSNK